MVLSDFHLHERVHTEKPCRPSKAYRAFLLTHTTYGLEECLRIGSDSLQDE